MNIWERAQGWENDKREWRCEEEYDGLDISQV